MLDFANPVVSGLAAVLGAVVAVLVGVVLFRAGCALADVAEPAFGKSLLLVGLALLVCVPLGGAIIYLSGRYEADPAVFGPVRGLATLAALLVAWVVSALLYALFLAASYRKGLVIAGLEMLLSGLLSALVLAVVLVVLAVVQIVRRPEVPPKAFLHPAPAARVLSAGRPS
jgi:hypothetical protein